MIENFLNEDEEKQLLKICREKLEHSVQYSDYVPRNIPEKFFTEYGVFVTLYKNNQLRGCIGYANPTFSLIDALLHVTEASALQDPRFPPVSLVELEDIRIEISILTPPIEIKVDDFNDYHKNIKLGVDGLKIDYNGCSGLFLPQVPIEQDWTIDSYLDNLCLKANLPKDAWQKSDVKIYKFQTIIIQE
ncbi:MAG: TIGR00296 family protein [Methanobacteriaceae archaeon]|nr:TIGR00296 family protein [Methanobacteriaceae archaeon]